MEYQKGTLTFNAATGLKGQRFVAINNTTQTAAYPSAGAAIDGITLFDERNGVIDVIPIGACSGSYLITAAEAFAVGAELTTDAAGKAKAKGVGDVHACYARLAASAADVIVEGYNLSI